MPWVIKLQDRDHCRNGQFVARPGGKHSYTRDILAARRFPTREVAEVHACDNETVLRLEEQIDLED